MDGVFQIRNVACWVEQFPRPDATLRLACFENHRQGIETSENLRERAAKEDGLISADGMRRV